MYIFLEKKSLHKYRCLRSTSIVHPLLNLHRYRPMSQKREIVGAVPNLPTTATTTLQPQSRRLVGVLTSINVNNVSSQKRQLDVLEDILTLYKTNSERLDLMQEELKDLRQLIQTHNRRRKRTIPVISSSDSSAISTGNSDSDEFYEEKGKMLPRPMYVDTQPGSDAYEPSDNALTNKTHNNGSSSNGGHNDGDDSDNDDHNGVNLQQGQCQPRIRNSENAEISVMATPKRKRGRPSKKEKGQEQQLKNATITSPRISYTLNRDITSVQDIWCEYTVGLSHREPAVKYLTHLHVTEFYINEREPIITEIIKIMDKKKKSEHEAVFLLEDHRITLNIDLKNLAKRIMVHRSIDEGKLIIITHQN